MGWQAWVAQWAKTHTGFEWLSAAWVSGFAAAAVASLALTLFALALLALVRAFSGDPLSPKTLAVEAMELFSAGFKDGPLGVIKKGVGLAEDRKRAVLTLDQAIDDGWRDEVTKASKEYFSSLPKRERLEAAQELREALQLAALSAGDFADAQLDAKRATETLVRKLNSRNPKHNTERLRPVLEILNARFLCRRDVAQALANAGIGRLVRDMEGVKSDLARANAQLDSLHQGQSGIQLSLEAQARYLPGLRAVEGFKPPDPAMVRNLPTSLVIADYGIIPYDDSRILLGALGGSDDASVLSWATNGGGISVRLYTAGGGFGKTRLALEAVTRLKTSGDWKSGLLNRGALEEALARPAAGGPSPLAVELAQRGGKGFFLAIDYAETRLDQLKRLALVLAEAPTGSPIRVVLMARTGGWWEGFLECLPANQEAFFEKNIIESVQTDIAPERRAAFFDEACEAFANELAKADAQAKDKTSPALLAPDWRNRNAEPAAISAEGSPLFLAFQAFLHVRGEALTKSPLAEMAREERRHHARAMGVELGDTKVHASMRAAALVTLCQGLSPSQNDAALSKLVRLAVKADPVLANDDDKAESARDAVRGALKRLYGLGDSYRPILPDLLGERVVAETLKAAPALLGTLLDQQPENAFHVYLVLNRLTRQKNGAPLHGTALVDCARAALREVLPKRLEVFAEHFIAAALAEIGLIHEDAHTVLNAMSKDDATAAGQALLEAAGRLVDVNATPTRLRAFLGKAAAAGFESTGPLLAEHAHEQAQRAKQLNEKCVFFSNAGDNANALAAGQDAVKRFRQLVATNSEDFLADLAAALNNISVALSNLGEHAKALDASKEAVRIYRKLENKKPEEYLAELTSCLVTLSRDLSTLGKLDEALAASQEVVAIRRAAFDHDQDVLMPYLATALVNLSTDLARLGRNEEALTACQEAVNFRRTLSERDPDSYISKLASSLNGLGTCLSNLKRHEDALTASTEAVSIYRKLVGNSHDFLLEDLAMSLNNQGRDFSNLGRHEEALNAAGDAVKIVKALVEKSPTASFTDLASYLQNQAGYLIKLGRPKDALVVYQEAVDVYHKLTPRSNEFFTHFATCLGARGEALMADGQNSEAAASFLEGVEKLKTLFDAEPNTSGELLRNLLSSFVHASKTANKTQADIDAVLATLGISITLTDDFQPEPDIAPLRHNDASSASPDSISAAEYRAEGYRAFADQTEVAIAAFEESIRLEPTHLETLDVLARLYERLGAGGEDQLKRTTQQLLQQACRYKSLAVSHLAAEALKHNKHEEALMFYGGALEEAQVARRDDQIADALGDIGAVLVNLDRLDEAERALSDAQKLNHSLGRKSALALNLANLGRVLNAKERHDDALSSFREAASLQAVEGNKFAEAQALEGAAGSLVHLKKFDEAEVTLRSALDLMTALNAHAGITSVLHNLGVVAKSTGNLTNAIQIFRAVRSRAEEERPKNGEVALMAQMAIADSYEKLSDVPSAAREYQSAIDICRQMPPENTEKVISYLESEIVRLNATASLH